MENQEPSGTGMSVRILEKWHAEPRSSMRVAVGGLGAWSEWGEMGPHFLRVREAAEGLVLGRLVFPTHHWARLDLRGLERTQGFQPHTECSSSLPTWLGPIGH